MKRLLSNYRFSHRKRHFLLRGSSDRSYLSALLAQMRSRHIPWEELFHLALSTQSFNMLCVFTPFCLCSFLLREFSSCLFSPVVLNYCTLSVSLMFFPILQSLQNHVHHSLPRVFLFLLWSIVAVTYFLMAFKWKCHAVRLINANNII